MGGDFFSKSGHGRVHEQLLEIVESYLENKTLMETWAIIGESVSRPRPPALADEGGAKLY